ncbi:MAG TPA: adenylate/guanylate cyclase domain-containing protein [Jatrophihabitans sp.]|nr:adenylate/guanylate cyclase domain-containing protein [Jatrophihabitans sp.]
MCSVLFVDLVGFTPLSESRDPEAVRELLSTYFDQARTVITRYGGVVEKFIGDAVMAVWGAPVAAEGDAERAVRAALELMEAVAQLGAESGIPGLRARAGVVTGEVAVTLGAVGEGMVAGDAVNTAARVQSAATAGCVLVDETTRRLAAAGVGFGDAGAHELRGKAEPVALFQATRVLSNVGGAQRVDGLEAPLVGRDAELRMVKELFHASQERALPRLVVISGPAGVGKSRLGWEFEKYIDGLADVVWWHRGRCLSYGEGIAYWAVAEMVRQRFGIAEEDPLDVAAGKLADQLAAIVPDEHERGMVGPRLARLLGVPYGSTDAVPLSRDELFAGWRLFFERLAEKEPVVMLIEDGQHADPALLDFLDQLVDQAQRAMYVLLFSRPELTERRAEVGVGRNRTHLSLDPLDDRSMSAMLEALVPGMPSDAVAAIASQAQGNPLFAIETIRSLIDQDVVVPKKGEYRLVGDVGSLQVPDSLHGLLAARLDALSPELRTLLADAAVLGTNFPAEALVAVSGRPADDVAQALAELGRRDILGISSDPLSPQRGAYFFRQNMLRQVAYDTLSRRDRKARHLAVAAHLRNVFDGDEIMEVVARHYRDALDAVRGDPDNAEIAALAIEALTRAAERARSAGAPSRAVEDFAEAAELSRALDATGIAAADLLVRAAKTGRHAADYQRMHELANEAAELYAAAGDVRGQARALVQAGTALSFLGRIIEARALLTPAAQTLRPAPDEDTVTALRELAVLETWDGAPIGSELSEEALVLAQELDVGDAVLADLFQVRGTAYTYANQLPRAVAMYRHAVFLAERAGDTVGLARTLINMSEASLSYDPRETIAVTRTAYGLAGQLGDPAMAGIAASNFVLASVLVGDWDQAVAFTAEATERYGTRRDDFPGLTALLAGLRGDVDTARAHASMPSYRASEDPQERAFCVLVDAVIATAADERADALDAARSVTEVMAPLALNSPFSLLGWPAALRTAFELDDDNAVTTLLGALDEHPVGHVPALLRAERLLADAKRTAPRDPDAARTVFDTAISQLRAAGSPFHLAHALLDYATVCSAAEELIDEAADIATRLGCAPLARRVAELRTVLTTPP